MRVIDFFCGIKQNSIGADFGNCLWYKFCLYLYK